MPNLSERLEVQIQQLLQERKRIELQTLENLAKVDLQVDALRSAQAVLTGDVERVYAQLKAMGIFKEF